MATIIANSYAILQQTLLCTVFIFDSPFQIALFPIHLVSLIKCDTSQVRFWINYWRALTENGDLIIPNSISAVFQLRRI